VQTAVVTSTRLIRPCPDRLPGFVAALHRGWSADTVRGAVAAQETLERLRTDPASFFMTADDPLGLGPPVRLPDGTERARLPGLLRWIWDEDDGPDGFAGSINLRWMHGNAPLPPHVLGHIGYAVPPWKQRRGHATRALQQLLPLAREHGQRVVELTTDLDNEASHRVIMANGGVQAEQFNKGPEYGDRSGLRFRIDLA
jgi:predicted acetyltransferase